MELKVKLDKGYPLPKRALKVKLADGVQAPKHAKPGDAGMDLRAMFGGFIAPGETRVFRTGVSVEIPSGYVGLLFPRSGLASKSGITMANAVGVIDSGYRGEIKAPLHNLSRVGVTIDAGERVCQLVVVPFETCKCVEVDELSDSERGDGGFGSTGE